MKKQLFCLAAPLLLLCGCTEPSGASGKSENTPANPDASVVCTKLVMKEQEVELTDDIAKQINDYYHAADIGTTYSIDSYFQEHEVLSMSDGSTLTFDNYVKEYAEMQQGDTVKVIRVSPDFYSYITAFGQDDGAESEA